MQLYVRQHVAEVQQRLREPRHTMLAITGPRQVGKTTIVRQALEGAMAPVIYKSADGIVSGVHDWIGQAWQEARARAAQAQGSAVLVLDEIQKIPLWSDHVKRYWDEDSWHKRDIRVIILGSSVVLLNDGLRESLAGRFERLHVMPWSFAEMRDAFGWDLETYAIYGGYPGSAPYQPDRGRWMAYMQESIIEPVVLKDILQRKRIDKPYLLRDTLQAGARLSGREISYTKLMQELPDAGNTSTLVHYFEMFEESGLLCALPKYSRAVIQRRSSPKLQVFTNAIATASGTPWSAAMSPSDRGRCYESMVGAHLRSLIPGTSYTLSWWRDGINEVDFVINTPTSTIAIEVSTTPSHHRRGLEAFRKQFPDASTVLVGEGGIPFDVFLSTSIDALVS
ncbi:MAG: ATP-binding protein [Candidatus Kapabacteria bacterium]|nr:ATP-binding protein [Candidatus Kapabacteria bacterium]